MLQERPLSSRTAGGGNHAKHGGAGLSGCACRLLPHAHSLPQMTELASALSVSRPARALHPLRPAGSLSGLRCAPSMCHGVVGCTLPINVTAPSELERIPIGLNRDAH